MSATQCLCIKGTVATGNGYLIIAILVLDPTCKAIHKEYDGRE